MTLLLYVRSEISKPKSPFSPVSYQEIFLKTYPNAVLENLWLAYKDKIQKDGRTIDRSLNYITTSEGQSYSLLRAVWMDDQETFDRVLKWTNHNLRKRKEDKLFAWKWGQNPDGRWDVLVDEGGMNTASDADQDIALALIFASKRWNNDDYLDQALIILNDIWRTEVYELNGKYYLTAGNWAVKEKQPTINPSYFNFAAYPIFAEVDPYHPWMSVKNTSYEVLEVATTGALDTKISAGLPPDWISLDPQTGSIIAVVHEDKSTHFSDDAIRVTLRVGLDWEWHQDERAKKYLEKLEFLANEWKAKNKVLRSYNHDGSVLDNYESNSTYGGVIPYFKIMHPEIAEDIYYKKLGSLYDPDTENFRNDIGYYAQNMVWFGMAFYQGKLVNLNEIDE